jgi:3-oxoadipate CoA-transferase beta subunit
LTGIGCVSRIFTELAVIDVTPTGLEAIEWVEGLSFEQLCALTAAPLRRSPLARAA